MQNNYHFFLNLVPVLEQRIKGMKIHSCFSQQKDELIVALISENEEFFIRADLKPSFTCLSFPAQFARARKNSVALFKEIEGATVLSLSNFLNERAFSIDLEDYQLVFKMFGSRSNIILFQQNKPVSIFRNSLSEDLELDLDQMDRVIDQSKEAFLSADGELRNIYPTLGKIPGVWLRENGYESMEAESKWEMAQDLMTQLDRYFLVEKGDELVFSLLKTGTIVEEYDDPIDALNSFYSTKIRRDALNKTLRPLLQKTLQEIKKAEGYIRKSQDKLNRLSNESSYKEFADIIMANLHAIPKRASTVTLHNFYTGKDVEIKLNARLTPQKNAENYYRKSKNQQIELDTLQKNIKSRSDALKGLQNDLEFLQSEPDLKQLREFGKSRNIKPKGEEPQSLPYQLKSVKGYEVMIGKNAVSNDELTFKIATRNDLWLHARDVAGSHVVIRHKAGQNIPMPVIEKAASLAAYNSKRMHDTLVPVIYTEKKNIRKFKGARPGQVKVDHEKVIMVPPEKD